MAEELDISPLAAEIILQVLRPVVLEYFNVEALGASVVDIENADEDIVDDA